MRRVRHPVCLATTVLLGFAAPHLAAAGRAATARIPTIEVGEPEPCGGAPALAPQKGRIVVYAKGGPGCTVELVGAEDRVLLGVELAAGNPQPMVKAIDPGTYSLAVAAKGYATVALPNVVVKEAHDTRIDVDFTRVRQPTGPTDRLRVIERLPTWRPPQEPHVRVPDFKPQGFAKVQKNLSLGNEKKGKGRRKRHARARKHKKGKKHKGGKKEGKGKAKKAKDSKKK